jgi:hypothetical protein
MGVEDDFHGLFEVSSVFAAGGIDFLQNADTHSQAGVGLGALDELLGDFQCVKNDSLTYTSDVGKHAMFDRIILGAVRWVVRYSHFDSQMVGKPLQVFLEKILPRAVTPAAIAQNQQAVRLQ